MSKEEAAMIKKTLIGLVALGVVLAPAAAFAHSHPEFQPQTAVVVSDAYVVFGADDACEQMGSRLCDTLEDLTALDIDRPTFQIVFSPTDICSQFGSMICQPLVTVDLANIFE